MPAQNVNPETNIRFGVIPASKAESLFEEIVSVGTNASYAAWKEGEITRIEASLLETKPYGEGRQKELREIASNTFDALCDADLLSFDDEEPSYSFADSKGNRFQLSYLGGAALIWCIKTSKIVYCNRLCSPCVPNGGDLDSGLVEVNGGALAEGFQCYGVPDEYLKD